MNVSYGFCECGCGEKTRLAPQSCTAKGWVRGRPLRHIRGHGVKRALRVNHRVDAATRCWIWQGAIDNHGYGRVCHAFAHRVYYERANGAIPAGLQLDHLCRNRACVNPDHLEPVTQAENIRRGRTAKLTMALVQRARAEHRISGLSYRRFAIANAERYGVTAESLRHIVDGSSWRDDARAKAAA